MSESILKRLKDLEKGNKKYIAPTEAEWWREWETFSELDKALFILDAENIKEYDRFKETDFPFYNFHKTIAGYLFKAGLADPNAKPLRECNNSAE